jgi:hypothetical protein
MGLLCHHYLDLAISTYGVMPWEAHEYSPCSQAVNPGVQQDIGKLKRTVDLNIFLVFDGIRAVGVQVNGGIGQKTQRTVDESAQISTKASRLMVRVRVEVSKAF